MLRAVRGAIGVPDNSRDSIHASTARLVGEMLARNGLDPDVLISVIFTATDDLNAAFPAEAARAVGLQHVPLLCAREIAVPDAMPRVVRILMHAEHPGGAVHHVYLDGAEGLRDDLA